MKLNSLLDNNQIHNAKLLIVTQLNFFLKYTFITHVLQNKLKLPLKFPPNFFCLIYIQSDNLIGVDRTRWSTLIICILQKLCSPTLK